MLQIVSSAGKWEVATPSMRNGIDAAVVAIDSYDARRKSRNSLETLESL